MGGRPAVIILRKGLGDKVKEVRITAVVEDLGFIGGRVALLVLSEALRTAPREFRTVEAIKDAATVAGIPIIQKA